MATSETSGNYERVVTYYTGFNEREWTRLDREPLEFTVNLHYIRQYLPQSGRILDIGAGPGKYAMTLAERGYELTLADLTPALVELAKIKAAERGLLEAFTGGFHVSDACALTAFPDEAFDAALMMGPLYHLQEAHKREQAASELRRVVKPGGIVFVAFRSRVNWLINALLAPDQWKPLNELDAIEQFMVDGRFDHTDDGRYTGAYFYPLAEIEPFMAANGFQKLELLGSTNVGAALRPQDWEGWQERDVEAYERLSQMFIRLARDPSVLGMSSQLLYIGRRV